ncbi:MAG: ankyrin repeat domain-containing protein, partial [Candidatus Aminicenantes bacterium]|nr:ankyrin repeat domain-containing protein [Candidatus Aminicenantes bacterium]
MMIKKIIFFMILIALVFFIQGNTIFEAASIGDIKAVEKMLLENPKLLHSVNDAGWTPLHAAVSKGRLDVVQLLLKKGAEVNRPENTYRLTPL